MNTTAPKPALLEQHTASDKRTELLQLDLITTKDLQLRVSTDKEAVARYAEAYQAKEQLPPIVVFLSGSGDDAVWHLADGHHRVAAAKRAGLKELPAIIKKGDHRDALLYAARANGQHGVPLTNDDKRRIVSVLLADEEWRKWSDREIAKAAQVSPGLVGKVRKKLPKEQQSTVRKGKDGATRDTKNIGKAPKWPKLPDPAAVMRQMAQAMESRLSRGFVAGAFSWNANDCCDNPTALTVVPPPAKSRGVFAVIKLGCHSSDRKWYVGYQYGHHSGEMFGPVQLDELTGHTTWQAAVRHEIMDHLADVWREHGAPKEAIRWLEDLAQALEHHEQDMAALAGPDDEPEELTVDEETSSAGEPAGKRSPSTAGNTTVERSTPPPIMDDTLAARRVVRVRELLAERLLKGKPQCVAGDRSLVSLALVVGVPVSADDEPWSDDLPARCWGLFADRLRVEVADRLTRGETTKLPPLDQLAGWWEINIQALAIQAERAVKG